MGAVLRQSGLILEVPEAEAAVGRHRDVLDANARLGVPAHVTVLFPFVPPAQIDLVVVAELRRIFAGTAAFDFRLTRTAWFGDEVLWLAPEDPQPFRILTELVHTAFPDFPPFEGQFDDVVPHLTVAHGCDSADMQAAERALEQHLPILGRARKMTLIAQADDSGTWIRQTTFPLAEPDRS
ncbi:2'-5' RNA ligase family protein [Micromonospora sp. RTP1Z1]|uniref:2'-5' RNA ligase family protein n=1 Tax=Micromonospora sp. RTP1Z1 TaxID=2994043 RepID=UPI0029C661D1|nr:2'-5' RNA ligase family protein [Micromonospora sp. RTP1Z1]